MPLGSFVAQLKGFLRPDELYKVEDRGLTMDDLIEMTEDDIGHMLRHPRLGAKVGCGRAGLSLHLRSPWRALVQTTLPSVSTLLAHLHSVSQIKRAAHQIPAIELDATVRPITRTVLSVTLTITPTFEWVMKASTRVHTPAGAQRRRPCR